MKRKRNMRKAITAFFLALLLILQAVTFPASAYAQGALGDSGIAAVGESEPPDASVTEVVYDVPDGLAPPKIAPMAFTLTSTSEDKTAVFMGANDWPLPLEVMQGDPLAVIAPGEIIQGRQPFTLKSEGLKVPVNGDDDNPTTADPKLYIQKGDWIELKREDHFQEVILPTATKDLMATTDTGPKKLGTAYFTPGSIKIVFDGDDNFFNGVGRGVTFGFETTANSDLTGLGYGATKPINIFGGAYYLQNPDVTPAYSIDLRADNFPKNGSWTWWFPNVQAYQDGYLTFHSTPSAFDVLDPTIKLSLDGMIFYTKPSEYNMVYVPGTFKVNGTIVEPTINAEGGLSYTFPANTGENPQVEYQAWFHKDIYYKEYRGLGIDPGRSGLAFWPKVELRDANEAVQADAQREGRMAPDWIQASASYDHPNETIIWTVVVNGIYNKTGLKNLTITNELPAGLDFLSATWKTWVDGNVIDKGNITPTGANNSVYSFGNIDGKVELVIKSKVNSGSSFRIDPRANWELDTPDGIQNNDVTTGLRPNAVTDEAIVTIGAHTFTKTGFISMEDYNLGGITWTVSLDPQYALPDAAVYDVLVHGGDLNVLDNAVDATGEVSAETIAKIKANVNAAQLWKQYQTGTLKGVTNADGLNMKAIPLRVNGEVVADLIKVTGYTTDQAASFSFRSLETNLDILFRQDNSSGKTIWNRALLFDGESVKQAQHNPNLHLRMLNKDMLTASYPIKADGTADTWYTPNNVHRYIGYDSSSSGDEYTMAAFDHSTKTVTFRLGVNMPGYNTVEMAKDGGSRVITDVKLVDTLPEGWEFVPFSEGKDFELWKGSSHNGSGANYGARNTAVEIIEPNDPAHVVNFTHNGNIGTFTFSKLESPYVILVKARPTNTALEQYLGEFTTNGTDRQVLYNQADLHMTWGGVEKIVTEQRKVIVPIQALGKSVVKPFPGVLEWTVNYYPPYHMENGVYLQDTIGAGMNLRYDESGELVLTAPSMAVYRAKLTASGALERDGAVLNLSDPNGEVQVEAKPGADGTTVLKFMMNDPNNFYQFVYQTEVDPSTAQAGDKMGNEVKLMGDDNLKSVSAASETTLDNSDVAGSSGSNALLPLKKVDPNGDPLQGVEFTLYKKDDGTEVAKGTTDGGGKLNLLFPDPGYYELKETYIDTDTWLPTTRIYQVYVGNTPGKPIWVDGVKVTTDNPLVVPTPIVGKLKIINIVGGNGGDLNKNFTFTITFEGVGKDDSYPYTKSDITSGIIESGMIKSGDTFLLKHGQSIDIPKLPKDLIYTVNEDDYSVDGYSTEPTSREFTETIVGNGEHEALYVNTRMVYGSLAIDNTVTGKGGDKDKEFRYTVTFTGLGEHQTYPYIKSDGTAGTIQSGGIITLKHGEMITIDNLPDGLTYLVEQVDYSDEEYVTVPTELSHTGSIVQFTTAQAKFVNYRELPGSLMISNTVEGNGSDEDKEFEYTVTFAGVGANQTHTYTKSDGTSGTIQSGDKFWLKHGQTITILGILKDTLYTVTETEYTADGYTTDPATRTHEGKIEEDEIAKAPYVNARYLPGTLALEPKTQKVRGDGKTPAELTATLTGTDGNPVEGKEIVFKLEDGTVIGTELTDEEGKATIHYTPPKVSDTTPKVHKITATTIATSPSGVPYNEDQAEVIAMPAALTGVLRDNNNGLVIPHADIIVKNVKTGEEQTITTDSEGKYYYPVQRDEEYTITYTKIVEVGGMPTPIPFTQKAFIEDTDPTTEGELIPAEITAVGIVLFKQPNGKTSLLDNDFAAKLHVYLKDANGDYIEENGVPKAFPLEMNGTFSAEGLTTGNYIMEVRYAFASGEELTLFKDRTLNVADNGELNISEELVDPYGIVYDENTLAPIEGAKVMLHYANTPRNIAKGITPDEEVVLPEIPGFAPNDNASPLQYSDATGFYAYMVYPEADYYLVVTKDGYETYRSPTISVEFDIVEHNVPMKPVGSGGGSGSVNPGFGDSDKGTDDSNVPSDGKTGTDDSNVPGDGKTGTDDSNVPSDGKTGTDDGNVPGDVKTGTDDSNVPGDGKIGTDDSNVPGDVKTGTDDSAVPSHSNNALDSVPKTGDDGLSPIFYMALALLSLLTLGFSLRNSKRKKDIQ